MITMTTRITCDAWAYRTPAGLRLPRCEESITIDTSYHEPRSSVARGVRQHKWYRDPASSKHLPHFLCPSCRKKVMGKP